jgi:hypothetical protein
MAFALNLVTTKAPPLALLALIYALPPVASILFNDYSGDAILREPGSIRLLHPVCHCGRQEEYLIPREIARVLR